VTCVLFKKIKANIYNRDNWKKSQKKEKY